MNHEEEIKHENLCLLVVAGGQGTRLWPISNPDCPKQFTKLNEDDTFIQNTVKRFYDFGVLPQNLYVAVTNERQREHVIEQLRELAIRQVNILEYPPTLGYAGCMAKANEYIRIQNRDAVVINTPSDQFVDMSSESRENFMKTMELATLTAQNHKPTMVGVKVSDMVTCRGCGHALYDLRDQSAAKRVTGFVEKPKSDKYVREMLRVGNTACNTGINVWHVDDLHAAIQGIDLDQRELGTDELMGLFTDLRVAIGEFEWKDCGTLKSLYDISAKDPTTGNATLGHGDYYVQSTDCEGCFFYTIEGIDLYVTGFKDASIVVNWFNDKLYFAVVHHKYCQEVRNLVEFFSQNSDVLTNDYSIFGRNNMIAMTNFSDNVCGGFVGFDNVHVFATKITKKGEKNVILQVSQQAA